MGQAVLARIVAEAFEQAAEEIATEVARFAVRG
jgi:hypothetical protein